jgi:hypothetical protein
MRVNKYLSLILNTFDEKFAPQHTVDQMSGFVSYSQSPIEK